MRQERREFLRHPIKVPIKVRVSSESGSTRSQTADLSEGGLSFIWPYDLPKGTAIDVSIPVGTKLFKITGRVAHSSKNEETGYRVGLCFSEPAMAFRAKLAEEILRITEFRKKISSLKGQVVSEEEAAAQWIKKYAEKFAELYQP